MSLAISMLSPVAEDSSSTLPWTFFLPDGQNQLHEHLLTHHTLQPCLISSVWHNPLCPNQAQHSRCVPQYPREEHQPSPPCWPCLCWYSPEGEAADTHSTSSALQILPWSQSPACPLAQLPHPKGRIRTLQHSPGSPVHQPLLSQHRLAGAVLENHCP